jgi:hypothetical protein
MAAVLPFNEGVHALGAMRVVLVPALMDMVTVACVPWLCSGAASSANEATSTWTSGYR